MRRLKTAGAAIAAILAFTALLSAITASTASATLPEFLPGTAGTKFTGKSGVGTLEIAGSSTVECKEDKDEGVLLSSTEALVTIEVLGCKVLDIVGAHSLGDPREVILYAGRSTESLCYINKAKEEVGLAVHIPPGIHVEVAGTLIEMIGSIIGRITPFKKKILGPFQIAFKASEDKQEITKCEGGPEESLLVSENGGSFKKAADILVTEGSAVSQEQELME
ncbi:MAG TPA: hypothetical protein VN892_18305 [Solirubrobacteraceae bacterium]|nr:hypothetical protein [Solirubrobacteraceae bacterium]